MKKLAETKNHELSTLRTYIIGYLLSIILTFAAYLLVAEKAFSGWALFFTITLIAVGQLLVQVVCFLHLGREKKPKWNSIAFMFMSLVVLILVIGSIWIMKNLDYNMTQHSDSEIMQDENIYR